MRSFFLVVGALLAAATALAAGCKQSSPASGTAEPVVAACGGPRGDAVAAHDFFVNSTFKQVGSCIGCHSPDSTGPQKKFFDHDPELAYQQVQGALGLIAQPTLSDLIQHKHNDSAITLSTAQRQGIESWLLKEVNARGLPGARPRPTTAAAAYEEIARCMEFSLWDGHHVGDLAFEVTNDDGPCRGCHTFGQGGFYIAADSYSSFDKAKTYPYIQKFFVAQFDVSGCFDKLVPSRRFLNKINEINHCDSTVQNCHPQYTLRVADPDKFAQATLDNYENSDCLSGYAAFDDAGIDDAGDGGDARAKK